VSKPLCNYFIVNRFEGLSCLAVDVFHTFNVGYDVCFYIVLIFLGGGCHQRVIALVSLCMLSCDCVW